MAIFGVAKDWGEAFGLAASPLFHAKDASHPVGKIVLLDGARGSFSLSTDDVVDPLIASGWAWSSDLPHHLNVGVDHVDVIRWDDPRRVRRYSRREVDENRDAFYEFLLRDKIRSSRTVVDHLITMFRRLRTLLHDRNLPDDASVNLYLHALSDLLTRQTTDVTVDDFGPTEGDVLAAIDRTAYDQILESSQAGTRDLLGLDFLPSLALRHASSKIFQEAHFEYISSPSVDMFHYAGETTATPRSRGTVHYTPPALARTLVELMLRRFERDGFPTEIIICDPACGSGAILSETLRSLRRLDFSGRVILHGFDISHTAIQMADFTLRLAALDWSPPGGCKINLTVADSLDTEFPEADAIAMNPPFMSWSAQPKSTRDQTKRLLSELQTAKSDLSTAFAWKAFQSLKDGGVLATLLPASLFVQQSAQRWRSALAEQGHVSFVGSIGEYGLFQHALVQVGCLIVEKDRNHDQPVQALSTENNTQFTSEALRTLRRINNSTQIPSEAEGRGWALFNIPYQDFAAQSIWRLIDPQKERALGELARRHSKVADIFSVRQGIQTGHNPAFVLNENAFDKIPAKEKPYFRRATMTDSIEFGRIVKPYYVFFPPLLNGFGEDEERLKSAVPTYFKRYLEPNRSKLESRSAIRAANRADWWGLMRSRSWASNDEPKIVSKYFGGVGSFAADVDGSVVPLTGFAWFLSQRSSRHEMTLLVRAYASLMNSDVFSSIASIYCAKVSGGQFDLSPRYVDAIPIPYLQLDTSYYLGDVTRELSDLGGRPEVESPTWRSRVNELTIELYGSEILQSF
jgi:tRNA1(Val) A37 N6-methylase TrmN6